MKVVNVVFGIATAIILGALINLGIKAFYPEPVAPNYAGTSVMAPIVPCASSDAACAQNNAKIEAQQQASQDQLNQQEQTYTDQMNVYNRNLFIIANIIGIVMFAIGFWLIFGVTLVSHAVPVGIMLAGLWSIMYGYIRGWGSVDDQFKFFIGLVIAVLVIGGSMWLMQRYQKNQSAKV
jgi:heme/copper-type cytochrome/quinol oxidase subunit 4